MVSSHFGVIFGILFLSEKDAGLNTRLDVCKVDSSFAQLLLS